MELLLPLLALALAGALVVLPFISIVRSVILDRQVRELRERLEAMEERLGATPPPAASTEPARPAPPVVSPRPRAVAPQAPAAPPAASVPRQPAPAPPAAAANAALSRDEDFESILGGRWMLYIGLLVLLFGVAFFLKYAFDNAWLDRRARCILGAVAGISLVPSGLRLAARGYDRYGHLVAGSGLVILYLTSYAALQLYGLIPRPVANVLFLAITVAGALLADRRRSAGLALLAIVGGYATPLLVGGSRDAQVTLFSYIAVLIGGTIFLARRHDWPALNVAAYAFTIVLVGLWADSFYTSARYLRTELFLTLYCALFLWVLRAMPRARHPLAVTVLATAPLLYYFSSLAILWDVRLALFVFLILFSGAALALSVAWEHDALRLGAWAAAALPFLARLDDTGPAWNTALVVTAAAIVVMHLAAQVQRLSRGTPVRASDIVLLHANGVFACVAAYGIFERQWIVGAPWIAWGLAAAFAALAFRIRALNTEAALHWAGLGFALAGAGIAIRFDGPWVIVTTAIEGAAITWIALRVRRAWFQAVGLLVFALACLQWMNLAGAPPAVSMAPLTNERTATGAVIVALAYALAWWHRRGGAAAAWWFTPLIIAAQVLTIAVLTAEASGYWQVRSLGRADARLASQLSLSLLWAGYAAGLVVVGMWRRYAPIRYVAIVLFAATVAKIFLSDLAFLGGIYRVIGFLVVGLVLVLVSFLYQRSRAAGKADAPVASGS
jgi:hypothetical protein